MENFIDLSPGAQLHPFQGVICFKLVEEGCVVGQCNVLEVSGWTPPYGKDITLDLNYVLDSFHIHAQWEGKGYGRRLLQKVLHHIREPMIVHSNTASFGRFFYLHGADYLVGSDDHLYECGAYLLFNVSPAIGEALSRCYLGCDRRDSERETMIRRCWDVINKRPHRLCPQRECVLNDIEDVSDHERESECYCEGSDSSSASDWFFA